MNTEFGLLLLLSCAFRNKRAPDVKNARIWWRRQCLGCHLNFMHNNFCTCLRSTKRGGFYDKSRAVQVGYCRIVGASAVNCQGGRCHVYIL